MKRYHAEMILGFLAYGATLTASLMTVPQLSPGSIEQIAVSITPLLPCCGICWVILRNISRPDEFQRKVQLETQAAAFAATALITFGYGFLENAGFPTLSMFFVWPLMAICWVLGGLISRWRYA